MSVPADTVAIHEQRSTVGYLPERRVPRGDKDTENLTTKLLAEGLKNMAEAISELDGK
jgi:hypothetical protein